MGNSLKKIINNISIFFNKYYNEFLNVDKNVDSIFRLVIGIILTIISIGTALIYFFYSGNLKVNNFMLSVIYYLLLFMFVSSIHIIVINHLKKPIKNVSISIKRYYNEILNVDKNADSIFHLVIGIIFCIISILMALIYFFYSRNLKVNNFMLAVIYYLLLFMFVSSIYIILINHYAREHNATRKKLKKTFIYFVYRIVLFPLILVFLILSLFTNGLKLDKLFKNSMYLIVFAILGVSVSIGLILLFGQFFGSTLSGAWFASTKTLRYFLTFIFFSTINYVIVLMFKFLFFLKKKNSKKEDKKILDKELEILNKQFCLFKYYVIIVSTFILKACDFTDPNIISWVDALFYSTSLFTLIRTTLNLYEQQNKRN